MMVLEVAIESAVDDLFTGDSEFFDSAELLELVPFLVVLKMELAATQTTGLMMKIKMKTVKYHLKIHYLHEQWV